MPTPRDREWGDAQSLMGNGGSDDWPLLDRIIQESPVFLKPEGVASDEAPHRQCR